MTGKKQQECDCQRPAPATDRAAMGGSGGAAFGSGRMHTSDPEAPSTRRSTVSVRWTPFWRGGNIDASISGGQASRLAPPPNTVSRLHGRRLGTVYRAACEESLQSSRRLANGGTPRRVRGSTRLRRRRCRVPPLALARTANEQYLVSQLANLGLRGNRCSAAGRASPRW